MLKPFYQGKLDTFCAIYAVLNALRLTHGLRVLKARDILNDTLLGLAASPDAFRAVLEQETDYCALVDGMLRVQGRNFPLEIRQPFATRDDPSPEQVWECCGGWLNAADHRAVIFRFTRRLIPDGPAVNRHWTTADSLEGNTLHLFDCSHEAEAILNIHFQDFATRAEDVNAQRLLHIQPYTIRLLRLPF
ncbi:hypothetical protein [Desulfovibrio legallii]|jgi:hypothetical protein|uniref:Uncharacterized protein n=1 Tax=Desulfovibrio legallii TaxID=571438 RepID=A0A1G7M854_9BACT|nr:hypothetical protein [Desulfovibrio legallii]SDF57390.1 hypothetical protein SAMN05192586_10822 [Desulfovibrio legallii]